MYFSEIEAESIMTSSHLNEGEFNSEMTRCFQV